MEDSWKIFGLLWILRPLKTVCLKNIRVKKCYYICSELKIKKGRKRQDYYKKNPLSWKKDQNVPKLDQIYINSNAHIKYSKRWFKKCSCIVYISLTENKNRKKLLSATQFTKKKIKLSSLDLFNHNYNVKIHIIIS